MISKVGEIGAEALRLSSRRMLRTFLGLYLLLLLFSALIVVSSSLADFTFETHVPLASRAVAALLFNAWLIIGASSVGAEWRAGSIATLLIWQPRRRAVFLTKAIVLACFVVVLTIVLLACLAAVYLGVALLGGQQTDALVWKELASIWWKAGVLGGLSALLGSALAWTFASATPAIVVWFAVTQVLEPLVVMLKGLDWGRWFPATSIQTFWGGCLGLCLEPIRMTSNFSRVLTVVALWSLLPLVASYLVFRSRDVLSES